MWYSISVYFIYMVYFGTVYEYILYRLSSTALKYMVYLVQYISIFGTDCLVQLWNIWCIWYSISVYFIYMVYLVQYMSIFCTDCLVQLWNIWYIWYSISVYLVQIVYYSFEIYGAFGTVYQYISYIWYIWYSISVYFMWLGLMWRQASQVVCLLCRLAPMAPVSLGHLTGRGSTAPRPSHSVLPLGFTHWNM